MGGPYSDRGRYAGGALEDLGVFPPSEEGGDPVDHVAGYVFGEEEGPKLGRVDVVEAGFCVEEEGGDFEAGSLKGSDLVGECGHRIRGAEAREGAALVWVEQARLSRQSSEPDSEDAFKDFRDGFEENDDPEGGWGVVRRLPGFVKDYSICVLEGGGVVLEGN